MAEINVVTETEGHHAWSYHVQVTDTEGLHDFRVTLSWSDYDLWSHGRVAPERVVKAAFAFLLAHETVAQILPKFDCSIIRRFFPEVDQELPGMV